MIDFDTMTRDMDELSQLISEGASSERIDASLAKLKITRNDFASKVKTHRPGGWIGVPEFSKSFILVTSASRLEAVRVNIYSISKNMHADKARFLNSEIEPITNYIIDLFNEKQKYDIHTGKPK